MTILRSATTASAQSAHPSTRYGSTAKLPIKSGAAVAFVQFGLPADLVKGAVIVSAKLRIYEYGAWTGSRTLSVQRNAAAWKVSQVNWNNKPALGGSAVSVTQSGTADLALWEFDVATDVQAWVNGTAKKYGWRLSTSDTTLRYVRGAASTKGKPQLEVVYVYPPAVPTDLHPSTGAVSIAKPRLRWSPGDFDSVQVQVDPAANGTTPGFDSGWVTATAAELDLSATAYAGLADAATTQWRVQVRKGALVSGWSQWATFSRANKPVATIADPTSTVYESTPPFNVSLSFGTFTKVQWMVALASAPSTYIYNSGVVPSTTGDLTPAKPVFKLLGVPYVVTVRAWDSVVREATFNDPTYITASVTTTLTNGSGLSVDWIDVHQESNAPWVDVRWDWSPTEPDGWSISRNGVVIHTFDLAADANLTGDIYGWRDWTAPASTALVYTVSPVVNGVTATPTKVAGITPFIAGVWVGDPDNDLDAMILGSDEVNASFAEDADTFTPIGSETPVRVVTAMRGLEGDVSGLLVGAFDRVATDEVAALLDMKGRPSDVFRLAWADVNIPVRLFNVDPSPRRAGTSPDGGVMRSVTFGFAQAGELPFDLAD